MTQKIYIEINEDSIDIYPNGKEGNITNELAADSLRILSIVQEDELSNQGKASLERAIIALRSIDKAIVILRTIDWVGSGAKDRIEDAIGILLGGQSAS